MSFMRCRFLLLSSLCISLISLPMPLQAQTTNSPSHSQPIKIALLQQLDSEIIRAYKSIANGFKRRNINQIFAYASPEYSSTDSSGKTINLQQSIQSISKFLQEASKIKYRYKIESISYGEQLITVSGTAYEKAFDRPENNFYAKEYKFQDTWIRTNNGLKKLSQHTLSGSIAWAAPRQQANPTGQAQVQSSQYAEAYMLAEQAMTACYRQKNSVACNKLSQIESALDSVCRQGDENACVTLSNVRTSEQVEMSMRSIK